MSSLNEAIVRADRRGRLRYTDQQRDAMLDAFSRSGLSGAKFAELHGVKYQTLAGWVQRRKRTATPLALPAPMAQSLVEVEVPASLSNNHRGLLTVRLPGGAEVYFSDAAGVPLAAALIRELSRPC